MLGAGQLSSPSENTLHKILQTHYWPLCRTNRWAEYQKGMNNQHGNSKKINKIYITHLSALTLQLRSCFDTVVRYFEVIKLLLLLLNELRSLFHDLSGDVKVDGRPAMSQESVVVFLLRDGGAMRVPGPKVAAGALEELQKVLLDRRLPTGQLLLFVRPPPLENTGHVPRQFLPDLPVQTAVKNGIGGEAEIADPGDHVFKLSQGCGRGGYDGRVQVEREVGEPTA